MIESLHDVYNTIFFKDIRVAVSDTVFQKAASTIVIRNGSVSYDYGSTNFLEWSFVRSIMQIIASL